MVNPEQVPIGKLISQFYRLHQKIIAKELVPYDVGLGGQHFFLKMIVSKPGITQDQMTSEIKFDKATTARSVKLLEESGYIERKADPKDRRSSLLYPTAKALEFAPVLQEILSEINRKFTADLTEEETDQLVRLLQKISKNASDILEGES
ncbi:MarR family winged helix-turn-helix transcriptional regulator [Gorillibacterium massiliense]|uniref:MarR family winged helix-turn-helix transcriptional regulator n=1 Tax=Gorillibacterium massiliense TaxID=1280390 RepID=UPI0004B6B2A9|nr:MarR family transcriptional regulator [Gorillibacterium massiliense]